MGAGSEIWGWDTATWRPVIVDAAGHLQVDVLSSALPALAATAANQVLINANLATLVAEQGRCYGYDGAAWQELLVESAAQPNLRTVLYVGGTRINVTATSLDARPTTYNALVTGAWLFGYNGVTWDRLRVESDASPNLRAVLYVGGTRISVTATSLDARPTTYNALVTGAWLFGFNGASWDRLRTYGTGILKVGRAEVGLLDVRMIAVGQVGAAGARRLYWMLLNPAAGNSVVELTDAAAGGAAVKADHFDTTRDGHMITFDPPLEFATGIWLETFANMTSITFGYL